MMILNSEGVEELVEGTQTYKTSEHPVYQANLELSLPKGSWFFAPKRGHELKKYENENQSEQVIEKYQKELRLYLNKYNPEITDLIIKREGVSIQMEIEG